MPSDRSQGRSKTWKRWAVVLGVLMVALGVGAIAAARLWARRSDSGPQRLDLLYAAWNEFNAKNYDQAVAILDRRAAKHEPTPLDWMLRARIAESQGRLVEALDHLKHIPGSDPISSQAALKEGQVELARHNARGAEAAFRRSLALNPNQTQSYRELAYLCAVQRRRAECDAHFRALAKQAPLDAVLAFAWSQSYCCVWDPNEALQVLGAFVEFDPDDRLSRLALATNLRVSNRLAEATAALGPLPESDPDARALRAQLALDAGELDAARLLAGDGPVDHVRLNAIRGYLALNAGDTQRAADYFRAALRRDPDDHESLQGLALALRRLGDPRANDFHQAAFRYGQFKRAITGSVVTIQRDPKLFSKLGELCEENHRIELARAWYLIAIRRDPLDVPAHQALSRLDQATATQNTSADLSAETGSH